MAGAKSFFTFLSLRAAQELLELNICIVVVVIVIVVIVSIARQVCELWVKIMQNLLI